MKYQTPKKKVARCTAALVAFSMSSSFYTFHRKSQCPEDIFLKLYPFVLKILGSQIELWVIYIQSILLLHLLSYKDYLTKLPTSNQLGLVNN